MVSACEELINPVGMTCSRQGCQATLSGVGTERWRTPCGGARGTMSPWHTVAEQSGGRRWRKRGGWESVRLYLGGRPEWGQGVARSKSSVSLLSD